MKNLKVKSVLLSVLAMLAISAMLVSCEKNELEELVEIKEADLIGGWWNSHEEETDPEAEKIFRPGAYDFPAVTERRRGIEFISGGEFTYFFVSPDDGSEMQKSGTWAIHEGRIILALDVPDSTDPMLSSIVVYSVDNDMMVVKPFRWVHITG